MKKYKITLEFITDSEKPREQVAVETATHFQNEFGLEPSFIKVDELFDDDSVGVLVDV